MAISRDDVARQAGVGAGTVSRVFNKPHTVAKATRERVLAAAAAIGYSPNKQASMLRRKDNGCILVAESNEHTAGGSWRTYSWLWASIEQALGHWFSEASLAMRRVSIKDSRHLGRLLRQEPWAGVLLLNMHQQAYQRLVAKQGIPYQTIGSHGLHLKHNAVLPDEVAGAAELARHLRETGHRRPLMLTLPLDGLPQRRLRHDGFASELPFVAVHDKAHPGWYEGDLIGETKELLDRHQPDVIFTHSSNLAAVLLNGLLDAGIRPGRDLSLVSYDNAHWLSHLPVLLTSVANDIDAIVRTGLDLLQTDISHERHGRHAPVLIAPHLAHGASVVGAPAPVRRHGKRTRPLPVRPAQ